MTDLVEITVVVRGVREIDKSTISADWRVPLKVRKSRKKKHNPTKVGTTFELECTSKLEKLGYLVVRSAASKTCIDLVATPKTIASKYTLFIQCKVSNSLNRSLASILNRPDIVELRNLPVAKLSGSMVKCVVIIKRQSMCCYQLYWNEGEQRWKPIEILR